MEEETLKLEVKFEHSVEEGTHLRLLFPLKKTEIGPNRT